MVIQVLNFFRLNHVLRNLSYEVCNILPVKSQTSLLKLLIFSEAWYTVYTTATVVNDILTAKAMIWLHKYAGWSVVHKALIRLEDVPYDLQLCKLT